MRGPILGVELITRFVYETYTALRPSYILQLKTVGRTDTFESWPSENGVNSK